MAEPASHWWERCLGARVDVFGFGSGAAMRRWLAGEWTDHDDGSTESGETETPIAPSVSPPRVPYSDVDGGTSATSERAIALDAELDVRPEDTIVCVVVDLRSYPLNMLRLGR